MRQRILVCIASRWAFATGSHSKKPRLIPYYIPDSAFTFDLFTQTYTTNHYAVTTDSFLQLLQRGYLYKQK